MRKGKLLVNLKTVCMKKITSFSPLLPLVLSVIILSCSKDSPVTQDQIQSTTVKNNIATGNSSRLASKHYGFISGVLIPAPDKASITAFNDNYSYETTAQPDGSFMINDLLPGSYSVRIDYVPAGGNDYFSMTIPKVVVSAGTVTNLGNISLD